MRDASVNSGPQKEAASMAEAIPRLAIAMRSVLPDANVQVVRSTRQNLSNEEIEIRFAGLPAWCVRISRQLAGNQRQIIETSVDLMPLCLAMLSDAELDRLAALENLGLRGVSLVPIGKKNRSRGGLRIRTSFLAQKGRTADEVENLAIDILTVTSFARSLEDRLTGCSVAGEFSFELYASRTKLGAPASSNRFITHGHQVFSGSTDRVFAEVLKSFKQDFSFKIRTTSSSSAVIEPVQPIAGSGTTPALQIVARIPREIPIFLCQVELMKLSRHSPEQVIGLLAELNLDCESGHFEFDVEKKVLVYSTWKHLTNDLRRFSFDHVVYSVMRAHALAQLSIEQEDDQDSLSQAA